MTRILARLCLLLILAAGALPLAGCGRQVYKMKHYVLQAERISRLDTESSDAVVMVSSLAVDSTFAGKNLVYRIGDLRYECDFYNRFLTSPSVMITEKTRNRLAEAGLCKRVLTNTSRLDPTHIIEGDITALYGDFRDKAAPKAVLEMRIFLLKTRGLEEPLVVFAETYESSLSLESNDPESVVTALDRCLDEILRDLEKDLAEKLF